MAVLSIGQVWATDEVVYTLNPVKGSDNGYGSAEDIDITDGETTITWSVMGNSKDYAPWRIGGKGITNAIRPIYSKDAISDNITKVVVTHGAKTISTVSLKLYVYSTAAAAASGGSTNLISTVDGGTLAADDVKTFNRPTGHDWTGRFYRLEYSCTQSGSSNKYILFNKAEFYAEAAAPAYTITAQSNDESKGTVSLTGSVITGAPKAGFRYASPAYSVDPANSATVAQDGNAFTVTPSANTMVTINFEAIPTYTVQFSTGNGNPAVESKTETVGGAGITLPVGPTPTCSADGWEFAGWKETSGVAEQTTTAPTLLAAGANFKPAADCTLYAVYKKDGGSGGSATVTITPSEITGDADPYTLTHDQAAYTIQINKNGGTKPAINATAGDARVYANSTLVISNASPMTELVFNISTQGKKRLAPITASVGSIAAQASGDETVTWTGNATEVTFTVGATADYGSDGSSKAGQLDFDNISATAGSATTYYLSTPTCAAPTCEDLGTPSVTVTNKTYNSAKLTWAAVDNADKYLVKFNGVDQEATENLYFDATGLEAEETYTYQVKALAEEGQDNWCDGVFSAEANFTTEPTPAATLTLSENTVTHNLAGDHTLGEIVTLPSADDCSKKFRGWSANEDCETEPELHAGDPYTLNATSQTLYAVYAKVMSVSDPSLTKQVTGATFAAGEKLVIVAVVDDDKYALYQETVSSSYVQNWAFDNNVATVAADAKKYVTLEAGATSGKYYLGDATNGYVYSGGSNNLSVDATNKTEWTIVDNGDGTFKFNQGRYLSCRSDLTSDKANLYRLAGSTPAGTYSFDVYKYSAGDATYGEWSTTCTAPLASPTFSVDPADGPFTSAQSVELSATEGTIIYYNINSADDPTSASTPYTGAIDVDACGSTTIKAIAISSTNQSLVASATYVLNLPIPENAENNPYSIATAKSVIDGGCYNNEDVYVTGTVASAQLYNSGTYTVTLEDGFQFYYLYKAAGETPFDSGDETIEAGDVLVAFGKLGMYNTTYQLDHGYLVSRTPAPKTPIDSDIDNPISVAAAVNYIDNAATYDLSEDEFVAGVVESIAECPQHEGTYDIIILDATDNTKQMKFFGCDVKTFTGIKQYDQITGKGKLDKYYSTYELNYPCEVVALTPYVAPVVDVTGVEVDETAVVKVGKKVQLTANVLPAGATNKNVTWSVKAGSETYAEVSATGLVTGLAEGEAIIVVTTEEGNFSDECTVTVTGGINFAAGDFVLVEDAAELTEGTYVIVAGAGENNVAMKYHAGNSDGNHKGKAAVKEGKYLHYDADFGVYEIKDYVVEEVKQGISFYNENAENYFALPGNSNQLKTSTEQNNNSSWTAAVSEGVTTLTNKALTTRTLRYNINSGSPIFACYTSGQQPIALYKYVTPAAYRVYYNDNVAEEEIEVPVYQSVDGENKVTISTVEPVRDGYLFGGWKDGEANVYEAGVEYTLSGDITLYAQWTTATVSTLSYNPNGGTLIGGETAIADAEVAEGTNLTIATNVYEKGDNFVFAGWQLGDDVYQPGDPFEMPATDVEFVAKWNEIEVSDYTLVTDLAQLQSGDKIIIVAANLDFAAGAQAGTYRESVAIGKTASKNNLILNELAMPTEFVLGIADGKFSFNDGNGYMYEEDAKKVKNQADPYYWTISIDGDAIATISATNELRYNSSSPRFTTYESGQQTLQLYRKPGDAPTPDYETVRSGLEINRYYTVCLPKKVTAIKGASFWTLNNKSQDGTTAYLEEETNNLPFAAGKPFIIQATAEKLEVVYEGAATEDAGTNGALHGTLVYMDAAALAAAGSDVYMLFSNELRPVGENNHLDANRAYVLLSELNPVAEAPQSAPGKRVRAMPMQPQVATGIDALNASDAPVKVLINGQLFIIRGEKMFDAKGQLVK